MPKERRYRKLEDTPIYIDVSKLLETVYGLSFSMQKKDRAVMSVRLLDNVSQMFSELALAYRLKHERVRHIDRFLSAFEVFKGFFRVLGSRIKYGRETCDDAVIRRAMLGVEKLKGYGNALHHEIGRVQASVNTYAGMFKSKAMYGVLEEYREAVLSAFGRYMEWNKEKRCFALKPRFSFVNRLSRKYGVRL